MEEGNATNNLRHLFPDTNGRCKIDCEASPKTFWYQYRGVFLSQSNFYAGVFYETS